MAHPKKTDKKAHFAEMAAILLLAAMLGIAWNRTLLYNAWTGKVATGAAAESRVSRDSREPRGGIPLPLGLMQVKELYDRKEAVIVDAREQKSFAAGRIAGAVSLPLGETGKELQEFKRTVPPEQPLVVYCNGYDCHDSMELGKKLLQVGYYTVYVFEGGFPEWRDAGYPTAGGKR